jgi:fermentation-respiration switch protein FrsA (DUF1100 family)
VIVFLTRALLIVVALVATIMVLFWLGQRRLIYHPSGEVPAPAQVGLARGEPVTFQTDDGLTLNGWFVPATTLTPEGTVIVFNGNAGNRSYRADLAQQFTRDGYSTLLFDYRGYGGNGGAPSEDGLARDARAARRYVASRPGVDPRRIIYFGESLGAAVAVSLTVDEPPQALILRSPYASLAETGRYHFPYLPVSWLLRDRYPSIERITRIRCPLLIIAGDRDSIVPMAHSRRLFDAASQPKQFVVIENADHNDDTLAGAAGLAAVVPFLRQIAR